MHIVRHTLFLLLPIVMMLSGCGPDAFLDRREFISEDGSTAQVRIDVDWSGTGRSDPTGMTTMLFDKEGNFVENPTNNVSTANLQLTADDYRLLLFNLSRGEFGSLLFDNIDSYDSITIHLANLQSRRNESWDQGVTYSREPENISVVTDTISITQQMVNRSRDGKNYTYVFNEAPHNIVSTLNIRVHVRGIDNIRSIEGSISGLADGYMPTQGHPTSTTATHLLDEWRATADSDSTDNGYITTSISTFGLPYSDSTASTLTLFFNLKDGRTTRTYHYFVGNSFVYETPLIIDLTINDGPTMPHVTDDNGSSGFDAEVDPWDDGGNTDINF